MFCEINTKTVKLPETAISSLESPWSDDNFGVNISDVDVVSAES